MYHDSSHFKPSFTTVFKTGINMDAKNVQCAQRASPLQKLNMQQLQQQLNQQNFQQNLQKQLKIQKQKFPQHSEKQAISQTISKQPHQQQQQLLKNCDAIPLLISHNTPPQQPKMQKLQSNLIQRPPQTQKHILHQIPMQSTLTQNNKPTKTLTNQIPHKIPPQPIPQPLTPVKLCREIAPRVAAYSPPPPTKTEKALVCSCCPYGYHIDLDFLEYLDSTKESQEPLKLYKKRSNDVKFLPEKNDSSKIHYISQHIQSTHSFIANPIVDGDITFVIPGNNKKTQLQLNKNSSYHHENYLDEEKKFRASTELVVNRYYNSPSYSNYTYSSMPPPIPPPPLSYSPLPSPKASRTQIIQHPPISYSSFQHLSSQHFQHYNIVPFREFKQQHCENIYDNTVSISEEKNLPSKQKFRSSIAIILEELENCLNSNNNTINITNTPTNLLESSNTVIEESSQAGKVGNLCSKIKLKLQRLNELEEQVRLIPDLNEHILSLTKQLDQLKKVDGNTSAKTDAKNFDLKGELNSTNNSGNSSNSEGSASTVKARSLKATTRDVGVGSTVLFDSNGNRSSGSDEGSVDTIKSNHTGVNNAQGSAVGDPKLNAMSHTKFYLKYNADDLHEFSQKDVGVDNVNSKKINQENQNAIKIYEKTETTVANMPPLLFPKPKSKDCSTVDQNKKINQSFNIRDKFKADITSTGGSHNVESKKRPFIIDKTEFQAISNNNKNISVENCKSHITKAKTQNVLKDVCFKENSSKFVYYPDKLSITKQAVSKNEGTPNKTFDKPAPNTKVLNPLQKCSVKSAPSTQTVGFVQLAIGSLQEVNEEITQDSSIVSPNKLSIKITPLSANDQSAKQEPVVVNLLETDSDSDVSEIVASEGCEDDFNARQKEFQYYDDKTKQLQAVNETIDEEFIVKRNLSSESQKATFQNKLLQLQQMLQQDLTQQPLNNSNESPNNTAENNVKHNKGILNNACSFKGSNDESSNEPTSALAYQTPSLSSPNADFSYKIVDENSYKNTSQGAIRNDEKDNNEKEHDKAINKTSCNDETFKNSIEKFTNNNEGTKNIENNKKKANMNSNNNEKTAVSELTLKEAKVYAISIPLKNHKAASSNAENSNDFYMSKSSIPYSEEDKTLNGKDKIDRGLTPISETNNTIADSRSTFNCNNLNKIGEEVVVKSVKAIRTITNDSSLNPSEQSVSSSFSFVFSDNTETSKKNSKNCVISEFNYRLSDETNDAPNNAISSSIIPPKTLESSIEAINTSPPKNTDQNRDIVIGGVVLSDFVDNIITDSLNEINCRFNERTYCRNAREFSLDKEVNYNTKQGNAGFKVLTEFNLEKIEKFSKETEVKPTKQSSSSSSSRPVSLLSSTSVSSSSSLTSQQHFISISSNETSSSSTFHDGNSSNGNSINDKNITKDREKDKTGNSSTDDSESKKPEHHTSDSINSNDSNGTTKRHSKMLANKKLFADILVSDVTLTTTSDSSPDSELWHPMKSKNRPKVDDRTTFLGAGKYSSCHTSGAISDPGELAMPKSPEFKSSSSLEDDPSSGSSNSEENSAAKKGAVGVTTKRKVYHVDASKQSGKLSDESSDVSSLQCKEFSSGDFLSNSDEFKLSSHNSISSLGNMIAQASVNDAYRDDQETPKAENFEQQIQHPLNVSFNSSHSVTSHSSVHSFYRKFSPHSHHLSALRLLRRSFSASCLQERESPSLYDSFNITSQSLDAGINEELANIRHPLHFSSLKHTTELQDITTNANKNIHLHIPADLSFKLSSDLSSIGDDGSYIYDEEENVKIEKDDVENEDGNEKYQEYRVGDYENDRFTKTSSYSTNIRDLETIIDEEEEEEEEEAENDDDKGLNSNKRENEYRDKNVVLHDDCIKNKGINASGEKTNAKVFGVKDEDEEEDEEVGEDDVKTQIASASSQVVKERSPDTGDDCFVEACSIYADHLNNQQHITDNEKETVLELIKKSWFLTCGRKMSRGEEVSDMLDALKKFGTFVTRDVINMKDNDGNTVLHYAISHVNDSVINILLETHLCDINIQNNAGYTALMLAALLIDDLSRHHHLLSDIFNVGNINASSQKSGQTALMLACSHKRLEVVALLLECGADVNLQDEDGSTALMCACEHGHLEVVQLLLTHPLCDSTLCDLDGSTALSISMEEGHQEIGVLVYAHAKAISDARELPGS